MEDHKLLKEAKKLLEKAAKPNRSKLTKEEIEDLRTDISVNRARLVDDVLLVVSNNRSAAELKMDSLEGAEYVRYLKSYSGKPYTDASGSEKKYTASAADSLARKALHAEGTKFYKAKQEFFKWRDEEKAMFQLLKAMDQVANALSAITKAS